jgi:Tfp pilus assembly protein PilV
MSTTMQLRRRIRGVSLVEALVALAVMSIGMLALVGVQSTMRLNSDLAKQRTEATRIASEEIERLRSFTSMAAVNGQPGISYDEIASRVVGNYQPPDGIGNTSYEVRRTVVELAAQAQKLVSVQVLWTDRTNQQQTVTLDSAISATAPTLGAMLLVPHRESPTSRNRGRHVSIPPGALDLGDGHSRYEPPGSSGLGWYFNNLTGVMRACGAGVTDYTTCPVATLVSGTVRFHLTDTQPTGAAAEAPQGPAMALANGPGALVMADAVGSGTAASCYAQVVDTLVVYACAVRTNDASGWGGQLNLVLAGDHDFGGDSDDYKSCRYTNDRPTAENTTTVAIEADPHAEFTLNADHPRKYCLERPRNTNEAGLACTGRRVNVNLINQNFLVIRGNQTCPTELNNDGTPNGQGQDGLILANTRQHQPAP